jgi:hypothetical protein
MCVCARERKLVTSASSNSHVLSLSHCSFHVPAHAFLMFELFFIMTYSGATALLKPGVGEEGGRHRPLKLTKHMQDVVRPRCVAPMTSMQCVQVGCC